MQPITLEFPANVYLEDIQSALLNSHDVDLIKFILSLDQDMADEGFSLELINSLLEVMIKEYESYAEYSATRALDSAFSTSQEKRSSFGAPVNHSQEWDEASERAKIFEQIKSCIERLKKLDDYETEVVEEEDAYAMV